MIKSNRQTDQVFYEKVDQTIRNLKRNKTKLVNLLLDYETYETAIDEFDRSVETLRGLKKEHTGIQNRREDLFIATFFPLNLPIYSLVLFGIAPCFFAKKVFIRPPEIMNHLLEEICEILEVNKNFPAISIHASQRHIFVELYAAPSDVILFTGKYKNAIDVSNKCPDSLLLYNGSGVNPFVILDNADPNLAAQKAVEMRCFNSGQDCAGPDAFIVPMSLRNEFIYKLKSELDSIKVGDSHDKNVRVSRVMKNSYIEEVLSFLNNDITSIVYGGDVMEDSKIVYPTIISKKVTEHSQDDFHEFFAPVFYVLWYENDSELDKLLNSRAFNDRAMYVSVFGHDQKHENTIMKHAKILKNKIVNDIEMGNEEYGGYGQKSNFVKFRNNKKSGPILISRDLHRHFSSNK